MEREKFKVGKEYDAAKVDSQSRCCGRKPIVYKTPHFHLYCGRCDRCYDQDGNQIDSWAWTVRDDKATRNKPSY